ncbi:hypothetical protein JYU34_018877 [Plutella xylostella]|uniref:Conserved oligomeric Golgi complex subunit 2 n=1 Tax=Plutella xylostella TaxID=51655 RepID=A0ABQ7PYP5_PLUXY|nr:hypothetical protein JYU34_018877 [Plutella xylostella]
MEGNTMEFNLPPAPRGLCFDRLDFVKTNFSVDNFLVEHQNATSLETMRDDLGIYLKVLRLAMIELINKDYANFVNLSATLIGFDKSIDKIKVPLGTLNEEVMSVKQCIESAMNEVSMWLSQRNSLQKKKQLLKYYSQTIKCLHTLDKVLSNISKKSSQEKIVIVDRAALEFNQLRYAISKSETLVKPEQKKQFECIEQDLVQTLNELLFQFWNDSNEDNMLKTLITLASLNRVAETESLIRKKAIAPHLMDIINEPSLQRNKEGLQGLFDKILELLESKLKLFLTVTKHSKLTFLENKYRFLVNCFWCEVESRLELNLASIFAPGNPKIFYKRYSESMLFIKKLEVYCEDDDMVSLLHNTAEYKSFQKRWNLPVYFQIRFQEIAGSFEATLQTNPTTGSTNLDFILKETEACWRAMEECWSQGIYIEAIAHKFWKLTLQLIFRYATWCSAFCTQKSSPKLEPSPVNRDDIKSSINLYLDSQSLHRKSDQLLHTVETKINIENKDLLRQSLQPSQDALKGTKAKIIKFIVDELFDKFNSQLKQVSDIPRLYRKTNRSVPTKPCTYLDVVAKVLADFHEDVTQRVDNAFLVELYETLFNVMTTSYYKNVEDVLTSVQKTEESLRRLKQIREKASTPTNDSAGLTDGDKIRLQLKVDVLAYEKLLHTLKVDPNSIHKMKELSAMVTESVKNIDIK